MICINTEKFKRIMHTVAMVQHLVRSSYKIMSNTKEKENVDRTKNIII